jgi:hypothetical protein
MHFYRIRRVFLMAAKAEIHAPLRFRSAKLVANVTAMLTIARCFVPKSAHQRHSNAKQLYQ